MTPKRVALSFALCAVLLPYSMPQTAPKIAASKDEPQYLMFQVFTGSNDPRRPFGDQSPLEAPPPSKEKIANIMVQDIVDRIGSRGDSLHRLGFMIGPIALDHSDDEIRRMVRDAFDIALEKDVAVGFHIDESMFWSRRKSLLQDSRNIEWTDWKGTPNRGREIDWGKRVKLAPQLCLNSPAVRAEITRLAKDVLGLEISKGIERLKSAGKAALFGGVLAGWESQIGKDFDSNKVSGYHALANRGFSESKPPKDLDAELESVLQEFIDLWVGSLQEAGIPPERIYSHVWFVTRGMYETAKSRYTYPKLANYARPSAAFGKSHRPGFSTYPAPGMFDQLYEELARNGNPPWASAEGTNIQPGRGVGSSGMSMETYLAKMFNRGAMLVTIFSWGIGGDQFRNMDFRVVTEGPEALAAYRKFLKGQKLAGD